MPTEGVWEKERASEIDKDRERETEREKDHH